jgi:hypothetical protein
MEKVIKKGKTIYKKDDIPEYFIYVKSGKVTDGSKEYIRGSFVNLVYYITKSPVKSNLKAIEKSECLFLDFEAEIPDETIDFLFKELSKIMLSFLYLPDLRKFPQLKEVLEFKKFFNGEEEKNNIVNIDIDEDVKEFFDSYDFFEESNEADIILPEEFEKFINDLKSNILEFNFSKFVLMIKKGVDFYKNENWDELLEDLMEIAIKINDRALSLYVVYISALVCDDLKVVNKYSKKNWEFLRFNGANNWIENAMRYLNNKVFDYGDESL